MNVRDFDYGIGDDVDCALQQLRVTIATQIRQAIGPETDPRIRSAYERAIQIAEGRSRVNLSGGSSPWGEQLRSLTSPTDRPARAHE